MKVGQITSLTFVLVFIATTCGQSLASDGLLPAIEREFIRIVDDVGPAIVEISAMLPSPDVRENVGTGIIIDKKGYIVTTESVVGGSQRISVTLADGRGFEAKIVGIDPDTDIALIKIDNGDLPAASLGNSDNIRAGSWVITMGRSYSRLSTLSFGVVSGVGPLPGRPAYYDAIKINAAVRPGNSGGGVIDTDGRVVGVVAAALAEPRAMDFEITHSKMEGTTVQPGAIRPRDKFFVTKGFFSGREDSFAIPINFARQIISDLMADGVVERGWLGIMIRNVRHEDMERLGLGELEGVVVVEVTNNSPAARAGIRKDDVIINFDDEQIRTPTNLTRMAALTKPGTEVSLTVVRDRQKLNLDVEIGKK